MARPGETQHSTLLERDGKPIHIPVLLKEIRLHENLEKVHSRKPFCLRRTSVMMPDLKGNQLTSHPSAIRN
ncbi:hypothetical protein F2P79_003751 [Pimephales promelas]|nr:hypothetical protein F2P79_003751 [Pimephales promelas]